MNGMCHDDMALRVFSPLNDGMVHAVAHQVYTDGTHHILQIIFCMGHNVHP